MDSNQGYVEIMQSLMEFPVGVLSFSSDYSSLQVLSMELWDLCMRLKKIYSLQKLQNYTVMQFCILLLLLLQLICNF